MLEQLREALAPPQMADVESNRVAALVNAILLSLLGTVALAGLPLLLTVNPSEQLSTLLITLLLFAAFGALKVLLDRGRVQLVGILLAALLFTIGTALIFLFGGIRSANTAIYFLVVILTAVLLRGQRQVAALFTIASVIATLILYVGELQGWVAHETRLDIVDWLLYAILFIVCGLLLRFAMNSLNEALNRAQASEQALSESNAALQDLNVSLEERVADRTRALELSIEVGRRLSTILDQPTLVAEVVNQIQAAFNYYHVHIYLQDGPDADLRMAGGTGEPGRQMLAHGHFIRAGAGLVGRAAATNLPVLVPRVQDEPAWLPNPLLPETIAEIAVPITLGERVLGVLDVQHNRPGRLKQEDVTLLESIASQVAVALQNARLFERTQQAARRELLINNIGDKISRTRDVDSALQVAVRELGRALNSPVTTVRLVPDEVVARGDGR